MKAEVIEFRLPGEDEDYLDNLGLPWQTINDQGSNWLLIQRWGIPAGYNVAAATLALRIPGNYSDVQIDMVYFSPHLNRADGKPIGALSVLTIRNEVYQQWSRHRTGQNPWVPGVDNISSHLTAVDLWLRREMEGV